MSTSGFPTAGNNQELANETSCLKAMLTLMLQTMKRADAGHVTLKMKKQLALIEDETQAAVFSKTVKQIKQAYRQQYKTGRQRTFQPVFASNTQDKEEIKLSQ